MVTLFPNTTPRRGDLSVWSCRHLCALPCTFCGSSFSCQEIKVECKHETSTHWSMDFQTRPLQYNLHELSHKGLIERPSEQTTAGFCSVIIFIIEEKPIRNGHLTHPHQISNSINSFESLTSSLDIIPQRFNLLRLSKTIIKCQQINETVGMYALLGHIIDLHCHRLTNIHEHWRTRCTM